MLKKDLNIVSSMCGAGLEREYLLLRELLIANGHYTVGIHYTDLARATMVRADINIFLEVVVPPIFNLSRENWFVPNSEWYDAKHDAYIHHFTKVLCKTHDCYRIWSAKVGAAKCVFTGFESQDIYRPDVPKKLEFLHVAGKSEHKNTEAIIRAWRTTKLPHIPPLPHLTVVTRQPKFQELCADPPYDNITCIKTRLSNDEIIQLMNENAFHLMPSAYEGFGHVIHEGLGCKGLVITTDAPPMNEYDGIMRDFMIPSVGATPRSLAVLNHVSSTAIYDTVRKVSALYCNAPDDIAARQEKAREEFLASRERFRKTFLGLVERG